MLWNNISKDNSKKTGCLPEKCEVDILIVGGGITGLTTAYFLKDMSKKVILVDKGKIGNGVTSKSTAKLTYLQGIIYQQLEKKYGFSVSRSYFDSQKEAIKHLLEIIKQESISCDLKRADSIIFTLENSGVQKIKKEATILSQFGESVVDIKSKEIIAGIKVTDSYVFHPIKYMLGLKKVIEKNITIYEDTLVQTVTRVGNRYTIHTPNGVIRTKQVVVASHYPFFIKPLFTPLKTYVKREYVNAARVAHSWDYTAINIDENLHSIRYYHDYILYGSNQHRLTSKIDYYKNYDKSRKDFEHYFHKKPEFTWMNQDIVSHDSLPFIGKISENMFVATAYNGWGITNGTIAGKIIADLIGERYNSYQSLFYPKRSSVSLVTNSFLGTLHYMKVYAQSLWKKNNPSYIKIHGIMYATYLDGDNMPHTICLLCPHMKCNLVFNKEEKTWDCPCHGSRFNLDGKLLEGPAKEDLSKK